MPNLTALASIDNHRFIHQQSVAIVGRCNGFLQILRCRIHTQLEASLSQKKKKLLKKQNKTQKGRGVGGFGGTCHSIYTYHDH